MKKNFKGKKRLIHQGFDNFPFFFEKWWLSIFVYNVWFLFVLLVFVFLFVAFYYLKKHSIVRTVTYVLHVDVT